MLTKNGIDAEAYDYTARSQCDKCGQALLEYIDQYLPIGRFQHTIISINTLREIVQAILNSG